MSTPTLPTLYLLETDRIGRKRQPFEFLIEATDAADLTAQLHERVRPYLCSTWYDTSVNLETGLAWIEYGRFGIFTVAAVDENLIDEVA